MAGRLPLYNDAVLRILVHSCINPSVKFNSKQHLSRNIWLGWFFFFLIVLHVYYLDSSFIQCICVFPRSDKTCALLLLSIFAHENFIAIVCYQQQIARKLFFKHYFRKLKYLSINILFIKSACATDVFFLGTLSLKYTYNTFKKKNNNWWWIRFELCTQTIRLSEFWLGGNLHLIWIASSTWC